VIEQEYMESEAAKLLRVSPRFLRGERAAGRIAFAQRGRKVLYPESAIREYQDGQLTRCAKPATGTARRPLADLRNIGRRVLMATS
jgi:hypothetical protein